MSITISIIISTIASAIFFIIACGSLSTNTFKPSPKLYPIFILISALAIRLICAYLYKGYGFDMSCFNSWATRLHNVPLSEFYSKDVFADYPPGYMYVLKLLSYIKNGMSQMNAYVVLKSPAIISDLLLGYFMYHTSRKSEHFTEKDSLILMSAYLFNPMVITDSALWGQVDSIYCGLIVVMVYLITIRKLIPSYFVFALCVLIKPQSFFFMPVLIFGIIKQVFLDGFEVKNFLRNLISGLLAIGLIFLLALPFGIENVIDQYVSTIGSSKYFAQNAFNLWAALGKNYIAVTPAANIASYFILAMIVAFSAFACFTSKHKSKYFMSAFILAFMTFMISTKMHERYGFAAVPLLMMMYIIRPDKSILAGYGIISAVMFFNYAWILKMNQVNINEFYASKFIVVASAISFILTSVAFVYVCIYFFQTNAKTAIKQTDSK